MKMAKLLKQIELPGLQAVKPSHKHQRLDLRKAEAVVPRCHLIAVIASAEAGQAESFFIALRTRVRGISAL